MGIIRVVKDHRYFTASNEPFNDWSLSWEAKGVLGYLLSKPNNWKTTNKDLWKKGSAGRDQVARIIKELKTAGYLYREKVRDEKGLITYETFIYESPRLNPHLIQILETSAWKPVPGDQCLETSILINTDKLNTNKGDVVDFSKKDLLLSFGIKDPKLTEILDLDPPLDDLRKWIQYAEEKELGPGFVIVSILRGDPPPEIKVKRGLDNQIPPGYEDLILR